jgi:hypothetical protein
LQVSTRQAEHRYYLVSYLKHPFGVCCLDCGFLALGKTELNSAERIQLRVRGTCGCPSLEALWCYRQLWIEYNLTYSGSCAEGIFSEIEKQRRDREGILRNWPGWTPIQHYDTLLKRIDNKEKTKYAVIGSTLTFLFQWLLKQI